MKTIRIFAVIATMFVAFSATASYLVYWDVENAEDIYSTSEAKTINFTYATIKTDDGTTLSTYDTDGNNLGTKVYVNADRSTKGSSTPDAVWSGTFDASSVSSFTIELWLDENTRLGWQTFAASSYSDAIWSNDSLSSASGTATALTATQFVPEPTSGMLMLLGMAGLALRRKRA